MKERGILFSAPMVRALLDGGKTQTRRPMSKQPGEDTDVRVEHFHQTVVDKHGDEQPGPEIFGAWWDMGETGLKCPYGAPGDRLWVREAWRTAVGLMDSEPPRNLRPENSLIRYEADGANRHGATFSQGKLRPSLFMPRWASRITLEITDVRVERLGEISEADAVAEGYPGYGVGGVNWSARHWYELLWLDINGAGSWDANPYVWAITFKRIEQGA